MYLLLIKSYLKRCLIIIIKLNLNLNYYYNFLSNLDKVTYKNQNWESLAETITT